MLSFYAMDLTDIGLRKDSDGWCRAFHKGAQVPMRHRHVELEVNLITRGHGVYLLEGALYTLNRGSLFWQRSSADHGLIRVSEDLEMWIAVFRPEMLVRICPPEMHRAVLSETPTDRVHKKISNEAMKELTAVARAMQTFEDDPPRYNAALGYWLLSAWAAHRQGEDFAGGDVHPAVDRAIRLLRSEHAPPDVDTLAQEAGLSPSQLSRVFARQIGMSIVEYRQRVRLDRFREFFGRGRRHNMTRAALRAGFGSYPQFHRVFKKHFGFSPAEYRRRMGE
ncbi:MAG: helix-turn-helix domain-containing protein [Phycisphaerae bacterium]|nr:helix-turn-helix domain-containing protein [Phycisphaerae bacterium]